MSALTKASIKVVIPFAPGGTVDASFRPFQDFAEKQGVTLVPVYKPGAEGTLAIQYLAESNSPNEVSMAYASGVAGSSLQVYVITCMQKDQMSLVSYKGSGIDSVAEVKRRLKGTNLAFGVGSPAQRLLVNDIIQSQGATDQIIVPYRGGALIVNDLLSHTINIALLPTKLVAPLLQSGKLVEIAASGGGTGSLEKSFPGWGLLESIVLVSAKQPSGEVELAWLTLVREYLDDPETVREFQATGTTQTRLGSNYARQEVSNIKARITSLK